MTRTRSLLLVLPLLTLPAAAVPPEGAERAPRPLPASLQGTEVDGRLDEVGGRFVPNLAARQLFDYTLSASGEEPRAQLRARLVAQIASQLSEPAAREARTVLDRYLAYLDRTRTLSCRKAQPGDLAAAFDELHDLRREVLGRDLSDAFFGLEEAQDRVALLAIEAARQGDVDRAPLAALHARLESALPEEVRLANDRATAPLRMLAEVESLRAGGAGEEQVRDVRERAFGREAADRLEALDREEADWTRRMGEYRAARQEIESSTSEADRGAAIERLRAERFSATERLRVEALDRIEREAAGER